MNLILDDTKNHQAFLLHLAKHNQEYEPEVRRIMQQVLKPESVFIDCGGHIGYFSLMASQMCKKVYTFEAETENYASLSANIKENKITNIEAYHNAVGDEHKEVELIINLDNDGGHALWDVRTHPQTHITKQHGQITQKVQMVTIDSIVKEPVDLIKIDVEGCELKVLNGAKEILKNYHPTVVLEINDGALLLMGTNKEEIVSYMESFGYTGYDAETGGLIGTVDHEFVYNVVFIKLNLN